MNHFKMPLISTFKFKRDFCSNGIHFEDTFTKKQAKWFEKPTDYVQKWKIGDTTMLQCESSIAPSPLSVMRPDGSEAMFFVWSPVFSTVNYGIYELEVDFETLPLPAGKYYLFQRVNLLGIDWQLISEPIELAEEWPGTHLIKYKHDYNDYGVAWTTGIEMAFRCECGLMDYNPERERTKHVNQIHDIKTLHGVPFRTWKLYVGDHYGVAPWVVDILNRIFLCSYINLEGKLYQANDSGFEVTRVKGLQNIGAAIEVIEAYNNQSIEFSDLTELAAGIVTAYNIDTSVYGPGTLVPIIDVEEQG